MISPEHIHPMIVHFPIVLIYLVAGYDLIATARGINVVGRTPSGNFSVGLLAIAAVMAIVAFYFGDIALSHAEAGGFESDIAETHESLGRMVAIALPVWALARGGMWWADLRLTRPLTFVVPAISLIGAALVTWTAYFGGQLVFDLGVNVAKATAAG